MHENCLKQQELKATFFWTPCLWGGLTQLGLQRTAAGLNLQLPGALKKRDEFFTSFGGKYTAFDAVSCQHLFGFCWNTPILNWFECCLMAWYKNIFTWGYGVNVMFSAVYQLVQDQELWVKECCSVPSPSFASFVAHRPNEAGVLASAAWLQKP